VHRVYKWYSGTVGHITNLYYNIFFHKSFVAAVGDYHQWLPALVDGGLNIPDFKSRLIAQKCTWITRLQSGKEIFRQAFCNDTVDWDIPASFSTPFPKSSGSNDYVDSCIAAWTDSLRLLQFDMNCLIWPLLPPDTQKKVKN
jgi:hypothetical protein